MYALAAIAFCWLPQCDPLEEAKLLAADGGPYDLFGSAVGLDGDYAVVTARQDGPGAEGSAYVFERRAGTWTEVAKLTAPAAEPNDRFGYCAALSGDWIAIGAPNEDDWGPFSGSVHLFQRQSGAWTWKQKLIAADGSADDAFGNALGLDGDVLVVGASWDDPSGYQSGAAYVFDCIQGVWQQTAKLVPLNGQPVDYFGHSVAVSGDRVVVGAYGEDARAPDAGAAYVFERSGGTWLQTAKLLARDGAVGDYFGQSVGLSGDVLVAGAPLHDGERVISGAAYVFEWNGNGWKETAELAPFTPARRDRFGLFVAVDGGVIAAASGSNLPPPAVFTFEKIGGMWTQTSRMTAADVQGFEEFGNDVDLSGEEVLVGAPSDDDRGDLSGSAYLFRTPTAATCPRLGVQELQGPWLLFSAFGITPGGRAAFGASPHDGPFLVSRGPCTGLLLDLAPPLLPPGLMMVADEDHDGAVTLLIPCPAAYCAGLRVQAVDVATCRKTNYLEL